MKGTYQNYRSLQLYFWWIGGSWSLELMTSPFTLHINEEEVSFKLEFIVL